VRASKVADGGGLYVLVSLTGTKSWRFNYRFNGSYKTLTIDTYPTISIKAARNAHADAIDAIAQGIDPSAAKREEKIELSARPTFREVAAQWQTLFPESKRAPKTFARDCRHIKYLNAEIGDVLMADLRVKHLADVLIKFEEAGKYSTRAKVQATAQSIAGFAVGRGVIDFNPFSEIKWAAAFTSCIHIPRPAVTEPEQFGHLLRKVDHFEGHDGNITGIGLKLLALTAVRPGELTAAKWAHFDRADQLKWVIPAEELKMRTKRQKARSERAGKGHEVPLSRQALALLRDLHKLTGHSEYLFPGRQSARTMSENTLNNALHALGYKNVHCAHGFRSSFSTIMNKERVTVGDRRVYLWEEQSALIEIQLDHDDASTRAIYARGDGWEERVELMQHWADLMDKLRSGNTPAQRPRLVAV
jgi:integrase